MKLYSPVAFILNYPHNEAIGRAGDQPRFRKEKVPYRNECRSAGNHRACSRFLKVPAAGHHRSFRNVQVPAIGNLIAIGNERLNNGNHLIPDGDALSGDGNLRFPSGLLCICNRRQQVDGRYLHCTAAFVYMTQREQEKYGRNLHFPAVFLMVPEGDHVFREREAQKAAEVRLSPAGKRCSRLRNSSFPAGMHRKSKIIIKKPLRLAAKREQKKNRDRFERAIRLVSAKKQTIVPIRTERPFKRFLLVYRRHPNKRLKEIIPLANG